MDCFFFAGPLSNKEATNGEGDSSCIFFLAHMVLPCSESCVPLNVAKSMPPSMFESPCDLELSQFSTCIEGKRYTESQHLQEWATVKAWLQVNGPTSMYQALSLISAESSCDGVNG